jgi:hypothetical protein
MVMAKSDAPNLRKAEDFSKICRNCCAWEPQGYGRGHCKMYDFTCLSDWTCDSWCEKSKPTSPQKRGE